MQESENYPLLLSSAQIESGTLVLARSMQQAPDMRYFIGDDDLMLGDAALRFYESVIRIGMLTGKVYTTPAMKGIAVWSSPENTSFTFQTIFRTGFLRATLSMGFGPMLRFIRSSAYMETLHQRAIQSPHWILIFLGVEPAFRSKGFGGILIQPVLTQADSDRVPCYVESANERNLTFYQRHGFEIVEHGQVPNGGPQVWVMVRSPV